MTFPNSNQHLIFIYIYLYLFTFIYIYLRLFIFIYMYIYFYFLQKTKRATPFSSTPFSSAPAPPVQKTAGEVLISPYPLLPFVPLFPHPVLQPLYFSHPLQIQQWQNYLGFLVGLSGVTLNRETTVKITEDPKKSRNKGSVSTEKTVKLTDSFIIELLELLVCDNALVRETVMSLTGTSLSPASYGIPKTFLGFPLASSTHPPMRTS
jgi:hypothetical protein